MEIEASAATGAKVLVIDDSNTIRRSAEIFLRQGARDYIVTPVNTEELVSKIKAFDQT